jgi:G3E family GTPase
MNMIDVFILTGFVGAGKTTTLNRLLRTEPLASANPALIINEFGTIGVDGALVEQRDLRRFEINKGSIFCICTKTDFLKALAAIADAGTHGALVIEATGIAETVDIESFLDAPDLAERYRVRANLCLVDAANFTRVAAFLKPAKTQVQYADALIVNKCDRVSDAERQTLTAILKRLNPEAPMTETTFGQLDADFLSRVRHRTHDHKIIDQPPADIIAVSISGDRPFDRTRFYQTLDELKDCLLRLKGNIDFGDGSRFVELAGTEITEADPADHLRGENAAPTALTAIAWNIDKDTLRDRLNACAT